MKYARHILVAGMTLVFAGCGSNEADQAAALALVEAKGCVACHGTNGIGTAPTFPNIAGQWQGYLALQLQKYRDGSRVNAVMNVQAAELTDDEIYALAEYYADQ